VVLPITKADMTSDRYFVTNSLAPNNIILISALFRKNEASWGVIYDHVFYHNFRPSQISSLTLINQPLLTAYCLWRPDWK
jgi:hypothetical protein